MAGKTTKIEITACDNELYLLVSQGSGSSELIHLKSGYNEKVSYAFTPGYILAPGNYDLTIIGINWGGQASCKVAVTTGGAATSYGTTVASAPAGVYFQKTIPITI